jgi:hypothetical protein
MKSSKVWTAAIVGGCRPVARNSGGVVGRRLISVAGFGAIALTSALLLGGSAPALAAESDPGQPTESQVWGGCVLTTEAEEGAVDALKDSMSSSDNSGPLNQENLKVAFVVVYTLNDHDGQPLSAGGFTGPVLCINPDVVGVKSRLQTDHLPDPSTGATSIDTKDAEDVFILRYVLNSEDEGVGGTNEKVICHSVGDQVNCFRISPLLVPE